MGVRREGRRSLARYWLVAAGPIIWGAACQASDDPVVLGLVGPFSQPRGVSMERAAKLAVREINAGGGVGGRQLVLRVFDDSAADAVALRVARQLYDDLTVVAVVGHLNSSTTIDAARIYNAPETPLVSVTPSASAPEVPRAGPYTFRVAPSDAVHSSRLAVWASELLDAQRPVIFYQNDDYGRGVRNTFISAFEGNGGRVIEDYPYMPGGSDFDFNPYAQHATQQRGADVVMIAGSRAEGGEIVKALRRAGSTAFIIGPDGLSGIEAMGDTAAGIFVSSAWLPDQPGARSQRFVESYARTYAGSRPDHRGAAAYDIVFLLARAIEAVGPDRDRIQRYLAEVGGKESLFEGVTGTIQFDENGDVVGKRVVIGVVRDKRLVAVEAQ